MVPCPAAAAAGVVVWLKVRRAAAGGGGWMLVWFGKSRMRERERQFEDWGGEGRGGKRRRKVDGERQGEKGVKRMRVGKEGGGRRGGGERRGEGGIGLRRCPRPLLAVRSEAGGCLGCVSVGMA